ncbi:MAG: GAF domain-containing protein, partial [Pseudomonadota bacterium]
MRDVLLISGGGFFSAMADWLGTQMGADLAIIGSLKISEAEYIEVLGWSAKKPGKRLVNYDACRGPCMNVIERNDTVLYHGELDELFPEDSLVQERGSKSYLGLPLKNRNGEVIGLLSLLWTEQLAPDEARDHVDALKPLINRIEAELVEHNISHAFGAFMNPIADDPRLPDKAIFRTIVQQAASIAQVHSAILTRCVDRDAQNFQILAAVAGGELLFESEDTLLPYEDTPCGNLRTCDVFFQGSGLQETFPHVELFRTLGVHAYCGFGIRERDGTPIGHLSLLHTRPIARRMLECRIVNVVASRARQELQRFAVEKEREDLRDALNVRKKLESLGLMAGTIAHDFNNQLAAIIGNTELAKIELENNHPAR